MNTVGKILKELREHLPFTGFAVLVSLILISFLLIKQNFMAYAITSFEIFHPAHVLFSTLVSTAIFYNYSKKIGKSIIFGILISIIVGSVSDVIFPYIGSLMFGLPISFHLPAIENPAVIFGAAGLGSVAGILFKRTKFPHFLHVFISVFASLLYIFAYSTNFSFVSLGLIFIITSISVTVPCCLSDIILPILLQTKKGETSHEHKFSGKLSVKKPEVSYK